MSDIKKRVTAIQGIPVSSTPPTVGQVLQFNGTEYVPTTLPVFFSPNNISGLQLWLRADLGVTLNGSTVSNWDDQSNVGDANRDMAQTSSPNQPVFNPSNSNYNNKPTLDFNQTDSQYIYSAGNWSPDVAPSYTMVVVGNDAGTSGSNQYGWFTPGSGNGPFFYLAEVGYGYSIQNGISYDFTSIYSAGTPSFFMMEFNNDGTNTFRLNADTPASTFSFTNNNFGTNGFLLGQGSGVYLTGSIAEVIIYDSILSDSDRGFLEDYIGARYGIAID